MSTRTHSRSRIRLLISAALLTAVVLPALTATTVCQAAEFDNSSTTIVNPWIGLTTLGDYRWSNGDDYRLTGTGLLDGATQMHTLTGLETVLGVECHVYSIDVSGTAAANEHYDICVAQDVNGNTRYLKVTGQDASGAVDWTAPSANEAPVLYPAELAVGQRLTWWNGRTLEVVADGVLLPRFDNGMGPYYRCVEVLVTDGSSTRRQWYCRYLGIVKEDCTVATTTTKTAKVPAAKSKLSASRGAKVVRPAAQPAPAPTADPAGWQRAFNIEDVFADYGLLEAALHELQKPVDEVTIEDLRTLADLDPYCFSVPSLEGIQMCDGLVSLFYHGDLLRPLQSAEQLKGLTALECLTLWDSDVSDLSPLAGLVNLRELRLSHNEASDVSPLAGLTAMETLALDGNDIDDISPLGNMAQLRHLYLGNNRLRNVDPLAGCTQLETLSLAYNNIEDISVLAGMTELATLSLDENPVRDISPLANLANLWVLDLNSCNIDTVPDMSRMTALERLNMAMNSIGDLSGLAGVTSLQELVLWQNNISDISPLAGLVNLRTLSLNSNQVADLSPLAGLTALQDLYASRNPITALPSWTGMENLERLSASFTGLSDLSPLREAPNLGYLDVSCANVTDLSPLAGLTNLWCVDVSWNRITDLSPLSQLPRVGSFLWLQGNLIEDLGPLVDNPGIGYGDVISVFSNPLCDEAVNVQVPALTSRGVRVYTEGKLNVGTKVSCEWLYRNTALATGDRHAVVVQLTAGTDWYKNSAYDVSAALNYGDNFFVQLEPTDDPMVWIVRSTRRETNLPRNVRITFTVTGRDHGGQATTQRPLVVRSLGDVDGNGGVEPTDMAALINALNGMPPQGYDAEAFDLDANGGAEPGDLSVLINILNGLPIP